MLPKSWRDLKASLKLKSDITYTQWYDKLYRVHIYGQRLLVKKKYNHKVLRDTIPRYASIKVNCDRGSVQVKALEGRVHHIYVISSKSPI